MALWADSALEWKYPYVWVGVCVSVCVCANFFAIFKCLIALIYKGFQIDQFQKDSLRKSHERTLVSDLAILAQKCSKIAARKKVFSCPCYSLLIDLGQDQQQDPSVRSGGISRGRVRGRGCWRYWHVTGDRWEVTGDIIRTRWEIQCLLYAKFFEKKKKIH